MPKANIISVLKKDHEEVNALLEKAMSAKGDAKRTDLFMKINEALTAHTSFEEEHIYPVLEAKKDTRDEALEAVEEHAVVKHLLKEIADTEVSDERWKAKITVLAENVKHHVKEEEQRGGLFDDLKQELEDEELVRLGEEFLALK